MQVRAEKPPWYLSVVGGSLYIDMVRGGPGSYRLKMNQSEIEAEIHTLRDGGLLMQLDRNSHVIYAEEEAAGTRLLIEGRTCLLQVEVMKMCMPLLSPTSGIIHFLMSEGQAMQAGELIARLDLDDPSAVRKAEPFHGSFPILGPPTAISEKVHQRCAASLNAA
ncbi:Acetyl-CoA carboxylase 1 [Camellia lanceoleosa]|uniref:Acetyl-CoA carboxylase 1 n=1 Tax=Camellia lanceoleosa TaxID=1840588 RepID=A0ACC0IEB3_9ERIC|nr:Acetyl-CoA carboxylase 1 [Camellia lanceoleosa]